MTAKIDWYREVLELEPNSKVFFPLARMLAESGETQEAIGLLERGLDRHPEYMEARLLLIEILYKNSITDKCEAEIEKLNQVFASYAGFWHAWAACLASDKTQTDAASLLRFLAAHFVSGPLQLHDVLNRGLDAIMREKGAAYPESAKILPAAAPTNENPSGTEEFKAHAEEMLEDLDKVLETPAPADDMESQPAAGHAPETGSGEHEPQPEFASEPAAGVADTEDSLTENLDAGQNNTEAAFEENEMDSAISDVIPEAGQAGADMEAVNESDEAPASSQLDEDNGNNSLPAPESLAMAETDIQESSAPAPATVEAVGSMDEEALTEAEINSEDLPVIEDPVQLLDAVTEEIKASAAEQAQDIPETAEASAEEEIDNAPEQEPLGDAMPAEDELELPQAEEDAQALPVVEDAVALDEPDELTEPMADALAGAAKRDSGNVSIADAAAKAEAALVDGLDLPDMETPETPAKNETQPGHDIEANESELLDEYPEEEQFSLRTRSMAEVLAEQGDLQGAIEIYQELAAAATSADELNDINQRLGTLQARLNMANASSNFKVDEAEAQARSKEKLLGMLEALAQRVEARAQG